MGFLTKSENFDRDSSLSCARKKNNAPLLRFRLELKRFVDRYLLLFHLYFFASFQASSCRSGIGRVQGAGVNVNV